MRELSASVVGAKARSAGAAAALPVVGAGVVPSEGGGWRTGAGCVAWFARRVSADALATPSLETGAKSGPRFGWSVALAIELDEAAGGVLFDAHADSALDPRNKITASCLMTCPFLLRSLPNRRGARATLTRSKASLSNKQTNLDTCPRRPEISAGLTRDARAPEVCGSPGTWRPRCPVCECRGDTPRSGLGNRVQTVATW